MNKNDQQFMVQKIRTQYMEKQSTELDDLRKLDTKVKRPVNVFAYTLGSIGAIVMGAGMSLIMTEIGAIIGIANTMVPGIVIGVVGLAVVLVNYPVYKKILESRKKKYASDIIKLSDKIINNRRAVMGVKNFFKNAFGDMKDSAKAQHEVDKANIAAVKAESKAQWEEAKAIGNPKTHKKIMQKQQDEQIAEANERRSAAEARIDTAKENK